MAATKALSVVTMLAYLKGSSMAKVLSKATPEIIG